MPVDILSGPGKVFVYTECASRYRNVGVGHVYDPETNRWEIVTQEGAPSDRASPEIFASHDKVIVWLLEMRLYSRIPPARRRGHL